MADHNREDRIEKAHAPTYECPQPCEHLSQHDAREGRVCAEHPCTCGASNEPTPRALAGEAMTAADRTRRQSAADHAGREARIEAVTRDLVADVGYYSEPEN